MRILLLTCLSCLAGCTAAPPANTGPDAPPRPLRSKSFDAVNRLLVRVPEGSQQLRLWFALPADNDPLQDISGLQIDAPYETRVVRDTRGNRFLFLSAEAPPAGELALVTRFRVRRREARNRLDESATRPLNDAERAAHADALVETQHIVIDAEIRKLAEEIVGAEQHPIRQARKIYDWILGHVEYWVKDPTTLKSSGVGSSAYTLEKCTGNCTDFHSLYLAVARAAGLPTRIIYGSFFKGPLAGKDKDQSYHCWVEFFAPNLGWLPLDVAVADIFVEGVRVDDKNRELLALTVADGYHGPDAGLVEYYFGNLDARRVSWHVGRDLQLDPAQVGGPVNALPKAHVEVDGAVFSDWTRTLTYEELR